ncbi:dentin sialophosphoprotein-like [Zootermopsis nevadensis]|uniref:dentin sialophosphoprotein-like n=1 Tax=Zootermopsis nevadensis TaxID=136037 RepID=UPI000B8EC288|nr:dentin sialophosphoprotein-like [Zootermopsis nevadensis]
MDVAESHVDGSLNNENEKEGEVSSTCNDNLTVGTLSNNCIETGTGSIEPSSLIQEELIHSDSPDTSGASAGQGGLEVHSKSEAVQRELSDNTENVGTVQSQDAAAVEHKSLLDVGARVLQHIPGENIQLLNIIEDSEIVLLDENFVISTTSEPTTFMMSYENQEEMQDVEMSTTDNTELQLEIPQSVNVSSAKASENAVSVDVLSSQTKICSWNPDSTTIELAEGSNNENESILFTEEEVSTTEEDVGNLVSTSNSVTLGTGNVLCTSGDNISVLSTTKAESVCGTSVQEVVQDMHTSQSHTRDSKIIETAPQNSGISTTCVKDINIPWQRKRWGQVKSAAETRPVEQASCESQASDSEGQTHSPLPEPSTSKQESHVNFPEQSVCTSKKPKNHNSLSNPIQDCVSSSKDVDIVNKTVFTRHQESNLNTTTNVNTVPQLSSALDLIKSSYYSPFDDEIPSPGSSTVEEQKYTHDSTNQTGECSTTNSSSNENFNILTKDQTSSSTSSEYLQEKVISDSNVSNQNLKGEISESKLKGNVKMSIPSPSLSDKSKEKTEQIILGNASPSTVTDNNLHQPTDSMVQSETMLSKPVAKTIMKHTAQLASSAGKTVTSAGKLSVCSGTNLLEDLKEMITTNKKSSFTYSNTPAVAKKFSCVVTDVPTEKRKSLGVTEASNNKSSDVSEKSNRKDFSSVTKAQRREESSSAPTTRKESSIHTEVSTWKGNISSTKDKDSVVNIKTSVKGMETSLLVTEMHREKKLLNDGLKVLTEEKETPVIGIESLPIGEGTSVMDKVPMKEKDTSLAILKENSAVDIQKEAILKKHLSAKEASITGIQASELEKETSVVSQAQKESLVSDIQGTLTVSKQVPDKVEHHAALSVPSKEQTIPFEIQVLPKEKEICVTNTQVSAEKENTSLISPDVTDRDNDSSGLQESKETKETYSPATIQLPVLKKETCTSGAHTQKNELSVSSVRTPDKDDANVMEALEVNEGVSGVISPRNKDKEIIRKRFVEVIAKQKTPTDYL